MESFTLSSEPRTGTFEILKTVPPLLGAAQHKKRTFGLSALGSMLLGLAAPLSPLEIPIAERDNDISVPAPPLLVQSDSRSDSEENDEGERNEDQHVDYLLDLFANHLLKHDGENGSEEGLWITARLTRDMFGIFRKGETRLNFRNAVVLVSSRSCQALCEEQLVEDLLRVCALHITCSTRAIEFLKTTRTQQKTKFKTQSLYPAPLPFVSFTNGQYQVPQQVVHLLDALLSNAKLLATTSPKAVPKTLLGVGSTSSVCQLQDGRVAKSIDFAHVDKFEAEKKILGVVSGLTNVAQLESAVNESLVLVTTPAGVSLNRLPWGSFRNGQGFAHLALALQEMATRGVVHRDVSPGNIILVEEAGANSSLCLIDFGAAMMVPSGDSKRAYSGSKFFASDSVIRQLSSTWNQSIAYEFADDLESLVKTVVYMIDFECRNLLSLAIQSNSSPAPGEVYQCWQRIWQTNVGTLFRRRIDEMRAMPPASQHLYIANWLENVGWSAVWTGL
ncbi:hypothetical protein BASA81_001536 [Batrachochytrium salamandrivorans]|nr:hypothetical protein BASA81_001536 [Batrachochytrium salamandrivorans]